MSMFYVVTGAAGFIGSNLVQALNAEGVTNIIAVDHLENGDKFRNMVDCDIADYFDRTDFRNRLLDGQFDGKIRCIFHQGACSKTTEFNGQYMMENNYRYSIDLLEFCQREQIPFIYASSAAVYGKSKEFLETRSCEMPLNVYGYSKFQLDQYVRRIFPKKTAQIVGMRYFNVYGPNESLKGSMASVALHFYHQMMKEGKVKLFAGIDGFANGEQLRDFVFVEDVVRVNLWFLRNEAVSGIFNLGTGRAASFNRVAETVVNTVRKHQQLPALSLAEMQQQGIIEYIEFPEVLKGRYQNFTEANIGKLREAGYDQAFATVEEGVARYIDRLWQQDHQAG